MRFIFEVKTFFACREQPYMCNYPPTLTYPLSIPKLLILVNFYLPIAKCTLTVPYTYTKEETLLKPNEHQSFYSPSKKANTK